MNENGFSHSKEFLNDKRYMWWNKDFLDLMAMRWNLGKYSSLADLGCGLCHWSRLLIEYLHSPSSILAIDKDKKWSKGNAALKEEFGKLKAVIEFAEDDIENLDIESNSFDVVTCQTVMIHVKDPEKAIREMFRIARPGGIVICSEPNNLINPLTFDSITKDISIDEILELVKYELVYDRGKKRCGEGDTSISEMIPEFFYKAGLKEIRSYASDKVWSVFPPYKEDDESSIENEEIIRKNAYRYFKIFGDIYDEIFTNHEKKTADHDIKIREMMKTNSFFSNRGMLMYLISGIK